MGIVEPRVVVKIPWTKIGRKTLPQENSAITKQMHIAPDATNAIKAVYQIADDVSNTGASHSVRECRGCKCIVDVLEIAQL